MKPATGKDHRIGSASTFAPRLRIDPWTDRDLPLLQGANTPEMTQHLGGPESDEKVLDRHRRYLEGWQVTTPRMFRISLLPGLQPVGSVGFWERVWHGEDVLEAGWNILTPWQGQGLATEAVVATVEVARAEGRRSHLHAFPSIDHPASNIVCRKAGFALLGECEFEYPKGSFMRCNDWSIRLT